MASSMICGMAFLGLSATQASAAAAAPAAGEVSEIVVTGTRIPTPNLTSVAPVTSVSSADIKAQGVSRVEDLINSLPQAFAAQGSTYANGSNGTATVSFVLALADMASVVDPNSPLPPTALTSLSLPTAAPEAHLLQDNSRLTAIMFRFPTVGQASWGVGLPISTWEVVP